MDKAMQLLSSFVVFIAATAAALKKLSLDATVEAEFGDECVKGSQVTLAHHGSRANNPPPCVADVELLPGGSKVGLSHFDLDTLGGLLRLAGYEPKGLKARAFWMLAGGVDIRGPHRLSEISQEVYQALDADRPFVGYSEPAVQGAVKALWAWWAWSQTHRCYPPRPDKETGEAEAADCSAFVQEAAQTVLAILDGDADLLAKGETWVKAEEDLNASSFIRAVEAGEKGWLVVVRRAKAFTNHLYRCPEHRVGQGGVALDDRNGAVTISREGDSVPIHACEIVQALWGMGAGGHPWIAGSPRDQKFGEAELDTAVEAVVKALS